MEKRHIALEAINRAIEINTDRIAGYEKAMEIISKESDNELQATFKTYRDQSVQFRSELLEFIQVVGGNADKGSKLSGKFFRIWMDIKSSVAPLASKTVLESCEKGEEEFRRIYLEILQEIQGQASDLADILQGHLVTQQGAYDYIKEHSGDLV